jgi:protein regulator of cytokinesis 1
MIDDYTEELLQEHEDEAERLRAEIESKVTILPKVRDWHALKADEEELERTQNDPNRFSARGGAMLREEKLRKRVGILLPRVSRMPLLRSVAVWTTS